MNTKAMSIEDFLAALASREPVPGGGGASALCGALACALASMVGNLTTGKKKYAQYETDIARILGRAEELRAALLECVDRDAQCFEPLSRAYSIPKDDPSRTAVMEAALETACSAPMEIMRLSAQVAELHSELLVKGSRLMLSDVGVGVLCCRAALLGASLNVFTNLKLMENRDRAQSLQREAQALLDTYVPLADEIYKSVSQQLL